MSIGGYYSIRDDDDVADWVGHMKDHIADELQKALDNPEWYRNHEGAAEILLHMTRPEIYGLDQRLPMDLTYEAGERGLFDAAIERLNAILQDKMGYISSFPDPTRKAAVIRKLRDGLAERIAELRDREKQERKKHRS